MALHDWTELGGWEGVHHFWLTELARSVKLLLPDGYRAYIGAPPVLAVNAPPECPDVAVRAWPEDTARQSPAQPVASEDFAPDIEVAVSALEQSPAVHIERQGRLIAAIELISPRNKDGPDARAGYTSRYFGYLLEGVHLLLVDVHRRPLTFSFADAIAAELGVERPALPAPFEVSYRVGEPAASGGRLLAIRGLSLVPGAHLPSLPLALDVSISIKIDLDATYLRAAADAYLP
jgi:hypothetical protein